MKLSVKILIFCLLIGILPLAGMVGYSLNIASDSLQEQAYGKLASLKEGKLHDIGELYASWQKDITMYSEARYVYSALVRLRDIIFYEAKPGERMDVHNEDYVHAMKRVTPEFLPWLKVRDYADAMILDDTGRIVYTVAKGRELGEDLVKGKYADSPLVDAWKRAMKGETVFVDFYPYEPLDGLPCAFMAAPIRRYGKEIEGVAMLRITIGQMNEVMGARAGMGETGEAYLVGPENLMRSDLFSDSDVHSVMASFANPSVGMMSTEPAQLALQGQSGNVDARDYRGKQVLASYAPVPMGDVSWGLVAKIDASEALEPVHVLERAAAVMAGASVLGIVVVTLIFLRFNLLRPLRWLHGYAEQVAAGDLESSPRGVFKGELKQVKEAIEQMVRTLAEKMEEAEEASRLAQTRAVEAEEAVIEADKERQARTEAARAQREGMLQAAGMLEEVVMGMREASGTVHAESDRIMDGANSLSGQVESTAASMEQLAGSIREVASNAKLAHEEARTARQRALDGSEVVRRTVVSIGDVHTITEQLKEQVASLGAKADSIGKVMNVISDIADQTNLLALNAAIEAARAGEAGRGFAVVADEVRKLAEKTMDATREVGGSITEIQANVHENIKGMDRAAEQVEIANELAGESGTALTEIMEYFESTTHQVQTIASASTEQSKAGEEINKAVAEVDKVSSQTAEAVGQTGAAIAELTGQIGTLAKLYGLFMLLGEGTVQEEVSALAANRELVAGDSVARRALLQRAVSANPGLEIALMTDAKGIQVTDSIKAHDTSAKGAQGRVGADWSHRDWFMEPVRTGEPFMSNIYYSDAIDDYCLTVSTPVMDGSRLVGVLAVDVRHTEVGGQA